MATILIKHPREITKIVVKEAMENTKGIKSYTDQESQIIGKTGMSLGSYGEKITVEIPERQIDEDETEINVNVEREVSVNITSNPSRYEDRIVDEINKIKNHNEAQIRELNSQDSASGIEVESSEQLPDGNNNLIIMMVFVGIFMFIFILFMFSMFL